MDLDAALSLLALDPTAPLDLAEVCLLLARDEHPDLDVEACLSELAAMAHEARAYLRGDLVARVTGLCRYLFHDMGFRGNTREYYDPRNSYLNQVLERRTGIPITLTAVAMAVGSRAGLEVQGVGLPGHFVAQVREAERGILFDPFHGGRQLTPEQCEHLVHQVTGMPFEATPEQLQPVPLGQIVARMLGNLKAVYLNQPDFPRALRVLERLYQLAPNDPIQQRDLGVVLLRNGQAGRAIDHLTAYLGTSPSDAKAIGSFLAQARQDVARWN
jgi:regulator of sirC expression with transglutaminase-like and TPR domain